MITSERLECIEHTARVLNESVTLELITEIRRLRSLCEEAAVEIESQWGAHCQNECGPHNLQLRLEAIGEPKE